MTFFLAANNGLFHRRTNPRPACHALALKGKTPVFAAEFGCFSHQLCGFVGLSFVGITLNNGALRNAVSRENNCGLRACLHACPIPSHAQLLGKGLDQEWMIVPGVHKVESEGSALLALNRAAIE